MKITIESTAKIVDLNLTRGETTMPARVWQGQTETGVRVIVFITRIAADRDADLHQFEAELQEHATPTEDVRHWPARMFID